MFSITYDDISAKIFLGTTSGSGSPAARDITLKPALESSDILPRTFASGEGSIQEILCDKNFI